MIIINRFTPFCFIFSILLLFLKPQLTFSQNVNKQIDSLKNAIAHQPNDTQKVNMLNQLSWLYYTPLGQFDNANEIAQEALDLSFRLNYKVGQGKAYAKIGVVQLAKGNYNQAANVFNKGFLIAKELGNHEGQYAMLMNIGNAYFYQGKFTDALENYFKALELQTAYKDIKDKDKTYVNIANILLSQGIYSNALTYYFNGVKYNDNPDSLVDRANAYSGIGGAYTLLHDYKQATSYYQHSLDISFQSQNEYGQGLALINMGNALMLSTQDMVKAVQYVDSGLNIFKKMGDQRQIAAAYMTLGDIYLKAQHFTEAQKWYADALTIRNKINDESGIVESQLHLGIVLIRQNRADSAKRTFLYSLNREQQSKAVSIASLADIYRSLSSADSMLGNYKGALLYYHQFLVYNDSVLKNSKAEAIISAEMTFHFSQIKDSIKAENIKSLALKDSRILAGKKEKWLYLSLFLSVTLLAIFLYLQNEEKKKRNAKELEFERKQADNFKQIDQLKSRFITNISHEFRTPLTIIQGNIDLLANNLNDDAMMKSIHSISASSQQLLSLINQMIDLAKIDSGTYKLHKSWRNIVFDIKQLANSMEDLFVQKQIHFDFVISPELETLNINNAFLYAKEVVQIVINNLLSNALKFTPKDGSVCLKLGISSDHKFVMVALSNTGATLSTEEMNRIFERFYQANNQKAGGVAGSGVGLSIVKELVMLHGGKIYAVNQDNDRVVFNLTLEVAVQAKKSLLPDTANLPAAQHVTKQSISNVNRQEDNEDTSITILIVEDNSEVRHFIKDCLLQVDTYHILEAYNGKDGVKLAQQFIPDVIISDVMMPEMDGLELCRVLKAEPLTCHVPVILLTAKVEESDKIKGLSIGADDYILKPFYVNELLIKIKNILQTRRLLLQKYATSIKVKAEDIIVDSKDKLFLKKTKAFIEDNLSHTEYGVETLAAELFISPSQLNRKLKAITGQSTVKFIRDIRMDRVIHILDQEADNISGAAYSVGFDSPSYFTKVFKEYYGFLPSDREKIKKTLIEQNEC